MSPQWERDLDQIDLDLLHAGRQLRDPGPVLLLGAPGVGKGTQAEILAGLWGVPKISTGDILRANVASGTELGLRASKIMKAGGLVPDPVMTEMVSNRLALADTARGFILDGFPRTVGQAQWLDGLLSARRQGAVLGIISMSVDYERIVERVAYRRVCPLCKTTYNTLLVPPKQIGKCDKDNTELEQRNDDRVEVLQKRLEVFRRETEPLVEHYRNHRLVIEVDAGQSPSSVTRDIAVSLAAFRKASLDGSQMPESRSSLCA